MRSVIFTARNLFLSIFTIDAIKAILLSGSFDMGLKNHQYQPKLSEYTSASLTRCDKAI